MWRLPAAVRLGLFSAPALATFQERQRLDVVVAVPYFDGLMAGAPRSAPVPAGRAFRVSGRVRHEYPRGGKQGGRLAPTSPALAAPRGLRRRRRGRARNRGRSSSQRRAAGRRCRSSEAIVSRSPRESAAPRAEEQRVARCPSFPSCAVASLPGGICGGHSGFDVSPKVWCVA